MNNKCYLGIDPGSKGFMAYQFNGDWAYFSLIDHDVHQIADAIRHLKDKYNSNIVCTIEDVHAVFGSSAKGTFSFGENKGMLLGILAAEKIPFVEVAPKDWQREMWTNGDKVYKVKEVRRKDKKVRRKDKKVRRKDNKVMQKITDTKSTSMNAAKRLFPDIDFRRTSACKTFDDNKVDATLICEYGRRKNL